MIRYVTGLAAGSLLLLAAGSASAADLAGPRLSIKDSEPAAPYRACSGERFDGVYLGATAGTTNLNSKWEETFADFEPDYQDSPLKTIRNRGSGGLTLGYNRVRCNFLIGIEADYNFADISGGTDHYPKQAVFAGPGYVRLSDSVRNYATLRGRLGFVANSTLFYATGGLAWANLKHIFNDQGHFGQQINPLEFSGWKQGWTVGGGFEHALTEMISIKGEALYMDFGKRNYNFVDDPTLPVPDPYFFQTRSSVATARIGINFKLGGPPRTASRCADGGDNCCPDGSSPAKGGHCPLK